MRTAVAILCAFAVLSWAQQQDKGPTITTEKGDLKIRSQGNMVFMAGDGGTVEFMSSNGSGLVVGEKGEKGDKGDRGDQGLMGDRGQTGLPGPQGPIGPQGIKGVRGTNGDDGRNGIKGAIGFKGEKGQQGVRGVSATDSSLVTWNECVWRNLNDGRNYGEIAMCTLNKARNDTWIRVSWNGNMRITRCSTCCMRWYFTVNGEECADPGAIDTVIFQSQNLQILRQTHLTGVCRSTASINGERVVGAGPVRVQFLVQECIQFGGLVFDAYTGWNSVSRITVEEIIPREVSVPEVRVFPPMEYTYTPNYCQYFFAHLDINRERNIGVIAQVIFDKQHDHTVLRITWEGSLRKMGCLNCCSKWWVEIDGSPCSKFEDISTSITSNVAQDTFAPTTISGFCAESGSLQIGVGNRQIRLLVGECSGFGFTNTGSGFYSTSRMIVEELPLSRDPLVNAQVYHPQWAHCAIPSISNAGIDNGTFTDTTCFLNKTSSSSAVRVTFNGVIRVFNCQDCCMRWYVTLNGEECSNPAPIEAIVYSSDSRGLSLHRGSTITGLCNNIEVGQVEAVLNIGPCADSNDTFDAFTGFNAPSTMTLEEIPQPDQASSVQGYHPSWIQCTTSEPLNAFTNMSDILLASNSSDPTTAAASIQTCSYEKQNSTTALKISWHGNIAVLDCETCCVRWFLTIDGKECSDPGPIDAALVQDLSRTGRDYDLTRPASIVGICSGVDGTSLSTGPRRVELRVGVCMDARENGDPDDIPSPAHALTGLNSVSRIVIEEIPASSQACPKEIVRPRR